MADYIETWNRRLKPQQQKHKTGLRRLRLNIKLCPSPRRRTSCPCCRDFNRPTRFFIQLLTRLYSATPPRNDLTTLTTPRFHSIGQGRQQRVGGQVEMYGGDGELTIGDGADIGAGFGTGGFFGQGAA